MHVKLNPTLATSVMMLAAGAVMLSGCKDDYYYDDREPDNLGESIYGYLESRPDFTYTLRLIDDLGYAEVLGKTGSKTLFPADDEAFKRFFASNPFGAHSYEQLTEAQKRLIMNSSMVNMAYLSDMLPNVANTSGTDGGGKGLALRRVTSSTYLDSIVSVPASEVIGTRFWERFRGKGLMLLQEAPMMTHFTPQYMTTNDVTPEDFQAIYGQPLSSGDIYVNNVRVTEKDIICKNGYVHVVDDVALPAGTMAEIIGKAADASVFGSMLDKFCAPYFDQAADQAAREYYNGSTPQRPALTADSVFTKRYFNDASLTTGPDGEDLSSYGLLYYDPSDPLYSSSSPEQDMGLMFVPTDKAMADYFNGSDGGYLRDSYGTWDNVPTDILAMFIKNHQKRSFVASLPHLWPTLTDETSYAISITPADVVRTEVGSNGVVFFIDKVLPPIDYKGVYASTLTSDDTKVMKWAITDDWTNLGDSEAMRFYMYLRSMENMYNLLVPTDEAFHSYRDPVSWALGGSNREIWDFRYTQEGNTVVADVYGDDGTGHSDGVLKRTVRDKRIIRNRMRDIIDMLIVVGDNDGGALSGYIDSGDARSYLTKGGATILVNGRGDKATFSGGGDVELSAPEARVVSASAGPCVYDSENGRTFFIDRLLHDPSQSVYKVLGEHPEFEAFFDLCRGDDRVSAMFDNDPDFEDIFSTKTTTTSAGAGVVVSSFNNFRYTVLVPTNDAIAEAFAADPQLCTWEEIALEQDFTAKKRKALYLLKFLKYHFVDNSAYISGASYGPLAYETAARNDYDKFHKVTLRSDGTRLTVTDEKGGVANVVTSQGLCNLMARDLIVNSPDPAAATMITSSSRAVIHQIDRVLNYK